MPRLTDDQRREPTQALIATLTAAGLENSSYLGGFRVGSLFSEAGELLEVWVDLPREKMHEAVTALHTHGYVSTRVHCPSQIAHVKAYPLTEAGVRRMLERTTELSHDLRHRARTAAHKAREATPA